MNKLWIKRGIMLFTFVTAASLVTPLLVSCSQPETENKVPVTPPVEELPEPGEPFIETEYFKLFTNTGIIRASEMYDNVLNEKNGLPFKYLPSNLTIPSEIEGNKVLSTDASGFWNQNFTKVVIQEGVEKIGAGSFGSLKYLNYAEDCEFVFPKSLNSLNVSAFEFTNINILDLSHTKVSIIPGSAFSNCKNLTDVIISNNIKEIGTSAFENTSNLKNLTIDEGVEIINERAFYNAGQPWGGLASYYTIKLPKTLKTIGKQAFYSAAIKDLDISAIRDFTFAEESFRGIGITSLTIPENSNLVFEKSSFRHTAIESIFIPKGTIVKDYAFYSNNYLKSVGIADDFEVDLEELVFDSGSVYWVATADQTYLGRNIFGENLTIEKENLFFPKTFINTNKGMQNLGISYNSEISDLTEN